jgi:hypothetical protein
MTIPRDRSPDNTSADPVQGGDGNVPKEKNDGDKPPLTLHPLQFEDAIRAALSTGVAPKKERKPRSKA